MADKFDKVLAHLPGPREFVTVAVIALSWRVFEAMIADPKLTENTFFITYATAIGITNLGIAVGYYLSSSKGAAEANARADRANSALQNQQGTQP